VTLAAGVNDSIILIQGGKPISEPLQSRADHDTRKSEAGDPPGQKAGQEQGTRLHDFFSPGRTATNTPEHLEPGRAELPEAVWQRGAPGLTPGPFPRGETL
jgi:hypothetical protein